MTITLSTDHPARLIKGCARHLRDALFRNRILGKVRFAELADKEAVAVEALCLEVLRETHELQTAIVAAAADGVMTAKELDELLLRLQEIHHELESGRVRPGSGVKEVATR